MPTYSFRCLDCGATFEKFYSIVNYRERTECECGAMAFHDIVADHCDGNVDSQMKDYSFEGDTGTRLYPCSVIPSDIDKARKQHPGTEYRLHNGCYLPVIKNRTHKKKFLKEHGFVEY